jgi:hypothetical protein
MNHTELEPFHAHLNRVVQTRTQLLRTSTPRLAERLGPDYRSFMYWLEGQRKFPAELLPKLCQELEDFELLDILERQVGRVAFHVPSIMAISGVSDLRAMQSLVKEVGEALEALATTLEDGIVTEQELKSTIPKLDDVIRECAHLKHWLERRCRGQKKIRL